MSSYINKFDQICNDFFQAIYSIVDKKDKNCSGIGMPVSGFSDAQQYAIMKWILETQEKYKKETKELENEFEHEVEDNIFSLHYDKEKI